MIMIITNINNHAYINKDLGEGPLLGSLELALLHLESPTHLRSSLRLDII